MTISFNSIAGMDPRAARYYEDLMGKGDWNKIGPIYINKDTKVVADGNHKLAAAMNLDLVDKLKFRLVTNDKWEKIRKINDRDAFLEQLYKNSIPTSKPSVIKKTPNLFTRDIMGGQILKNDLKELSLKKIYESIYNRSEMPQIDSKDLPEAINFLKNLIPCSIVELLPNQIKNSQKEIIKDKVQNIIKDMRSGQKMPPCIISKDQWMVDGHHRNVAYKIEEPNETKKYIEIQLPRDQAIEIYKKLEGIL